MLSKGQRRFGSVSTLTGGGKWWAAWRFETTPCWGGVWNFAVNTQPTRMTRAQSRRLHFHFTTCEIHMYASTPWGPSKKVWLPAASSQFSICFQNKRRRCPHVDANKKMTRPHKWVVANRREATLQSSQTMRTWMRRCSSMQPKYYTRTPRTYVELSLHIPRDVNLKLFFWWVRFWKNGCNTWLCTCMQTKTWYSWSFQWLQSRFPNFY